MKDTYREIYKLRNDELISLIQGKSLHFVVANQFDIEVRPPNHGITMSYKDWDYIKSLLPLLHTPFNDMQEFVKKIEERR